jgi:hypothetical protein
MKVQQIVKTAVLSCLCAFIFAAPLFSAEPKLSPPQDPGVYIKTTSGLKRILPNIAHEEKGIFFIEMNNPATYPLKDVEYFVVFGKYDMDLLTLNPMVFLQQTPLGKARFMFGKNIEFTATPRSKDFYTLKAKDLLGRGYFSLWINDTAWDFIID